LLRPRTGALRLSSLSRRLVSKVTIWTLLLVLGGAGAWAGGSGLNVVVVVNQNSANSVQLGNDYCEKRGVPPQNLFRMTGWSGGAISWSRSEFETNLRNPLFARLEAAGLTNQVHYVLLSMDIPYRVVDGGSANSTTSALFYGFKTNTVPAPGNPDTCSLPDYSSNSFAFSELPFEVALPNTADTNGLLAFMLTDTSLAGAELILSRSLAADGSFPTQAVYLEKTSDVARNVRFVSFDNAIFDSQLRGDSSVIRITSDSTAFENIRGLLTGFATLGLRADAFIPGGLADSLTSYGGALFEDTGQTPLLAFLNAGATASYGTVVEPCNYTQKFPDPLAFFYQSRGFCAAEAYYQSVLNPYQGLFVGEPLCAPYATPGQAAWQGLTNGALLSGNASVSPARFFSFATNLPLGQVDLFVDGTFAQNLTNLLPAAGNVLSVTVNGSNFQYSVPNGASLSTVAAGLTAALNAGSNATKVAAFNSGDRIELQSVDLSTPGSNVLLSASTLAGSAAQRNVTLSVARANFLDTAAAGYLGLTVTNPTANGDWLRLEVTKTNGTQLSIGVTNTSGLTNVSDLCQLLMSAVNNSPALQGADGVVAGDLYPDVNAAHFFLYARTTGWASSQARANLAASSNLNVLTSSNLTLEDNISDLRPRNHLYVSAGMTQLDVGFTLDTTQLADGVHELTLVAYEGTSVRTQTRISRSVTVRNTGLSASLVPRVAGTNMTLDVPLVISVVANTNAVANIELFSSGGSIGVVSNQASAIFSVPTNLLGIGLHPFYAVVTDASGERFRTPPVSIRIVSPFLVNISGQPLTLSWLSVLGVSYDILASASASGPFQKIGSLTATGSNSQWTIPSTATQAFYRLQLSP
jgi:uncharacterized protein (TIGR03790 family)